MTQISITLVYEDGSTWFAGTFASQQAADAWVETEKTRPYWVETTQVHKTVIETKKL